MCSLLQWQMVVNKLFIEYYGMNINDTAFCEANYARYFWNDCVHLYQAVNEWACKYDLQRLDLTDCDLNESDELSVK